MIGIQVEVKIREALGGGRKVRDDEDEEEGGGTTQEALNLHSRQAANTLCRVYTDPP